jgi:hypothetical protein
MPEFDASQIEWRKPWMQYPSDSAESLESELRNEMCPGHVLFERAFVAIGWRRGVDDFLFYLGDTSPRFAVVHLTWRKESSPDWPHTKLFETLDDWIQQGMAIDAEEYSR